MSDVYVPGINSRFNSEKLIEDLMKVERAPRERSERNIDSLTAQKTWWQDLGRRVTALRESARMMYSFQNPFNERIATSADENVITATASREAVEREYRFSVKQLAQADRFISPPLDDKTRVDAGTYTFSAGKDEISLNFRGGSLREFADALNRRGRDKLGATLITVQPGTTSLLIESKITGAGNRLGFSGAAADLAVRLGIVEQTNESRRELPITESTVRETPLPGGLPPSGPIAVNGGVLAIPPLASASIPFGLTVEADSPLALKIDTLTAMRTDNPFAIPLPPPGPSIPSSGSITYGGITIENTPSEVTLPEWTPPPPPSRLDNLAVFSLTFSDGSRVALPPITDTGSFASREFKLADFAAGKTITGLSIDNGNTHRDISLRGAVIYDPGAVGGGFRPLKPVSTAQDAIIAMEGIEMNRPTNVINDVIPGVTVTARSVSERPVRISVETDREGIKDAIITLIGTYNRLMAEINVLTTPLPVSRYSNDRAEAAMSIINELTYLDKDEAEEMRLRLGAFAGDSSLTQLRTSLQRAVSSPYPTDAERDLAMLAQIGIGTNINRGAGYNRSNLRGYLDIDPKALDAALEQNLPAMRQLFGSDTDGDLIADTGVAFSLESLSRPFVETGGIITLKTGTIDSRISQDRRRIETMDRQLAAKEAQLRVEYGRMEGAWARMEQLSSSLDNFSQQANNNR